jgi:ParB family transcriptional regulator, chromosome partitioning protein
VDRRDLHATLRTACHPAIRTSRSALAGSFVSSNFFARVRTAEGALRVETGHRRTLAAIEAGLATVPVLVVADERTDHAGTVERLLRLYAENEHRTGLTNSERLGVVEHLALLNVSAAQIGKSTRMKRADVDNAIAVTRSELAKAANDRYELTLNQAAAVAEFSVKTSRTCRR